MKKERILKPMETSTVNMVSSLKPREIFMEKMIRSLRREYQELEQLAHGDDEPDIREICDHEFYLVTAMLEFIEYLDWKQRQN